jgi:hypothetical protein
MEARKRFWVTMSSLYIDTPLYIVSTKDGVIKNGKYKGDGLLPFDKNKRMLYFTTKDCDFVQTIVVPDWNMISVETNGYCITPSKAYAKDLSLKYSQGK